MRNFTIFVAGLLCLFLTKMSAQDTFTQRAKAIAVKIEQITKEEKDALKREVDEVNSQLASGAITNEEADNRKLQFAETRAKNIENRTAGAQDQLRQLVQEKVDGKIAEDSSKTFAIKWESKHKDSLYREPRTTSQFVFATGLNNLVTNNSVAHSDYKVWGSHFYEWGVTYNTRIFKNDNLLHAKYGLSIMYNNLRATENRILAENGDQTNLVTSPIHLEDSRFRIVNLVVPVHFEFDFSGNENDNGAFRTHQSFRVGMGGYAGVNLKSKQILRYEQNGNDVRERTRGDFNVNDFIYGLSAYVGYKETSLYVKYDLNPLFADNAVDQRNISLGIRFDLN